MNINKSDLEVLNELKLDLSLKPNFEFLKSCLIWDDEATSNLSNDGREFLYDLFITRGFIHKELPESEWGLDPEYFKSVWNFGLKNIPDWPGFKRLNLSQEDKQYLLKSLKKN